MSAFFFLVNSLKLEELYVKIIFYIGCDKIEKGKNVTKFRTKLFICFLIKPHCIQSLSVI